MELLKMELMGKLCRVARERVFWLQKRAADGFVPSTARVNINFEEGLFQITFFFQIGNGLLQFGIPFGSEAGDERLLEKTIDG